MADVLMVEFDQVDLHACIEQMRNDELNELEFGVIGFDADGQVRRYNALESRLAGLSPERVLGTNVFTSVAPCLNNFLVAQRFEDTQAAGEVLDAAIPYVFTFRMRQIKVTLRLLAAPDLKLRYIIVKRPA